MVHVPSGDVKQEWEWDQQIEFLEAAGQSLEVLSSAILGMSPTEERERRRMWGLHSLICEIRRDVQAVHFALTSQAEDCDAVPPPEPDAEDEVVVDVPDPMPDTADKDSREKLRNASQIIGDVGLKMESLAELCNGNSSMENTDGLGLLLEQLAQEILAAQADIAGTI